MRYGSSEDAQYAKEDDLRSRYRELLGVPQSNIASKEMSVIEHELYRRDIIELTKSFMARGINRSRADQLSIAVRNIQAAKHALYKPPLPQQEVDALTSVLEERGWSVMWNEQHEVFVSKEHDIQ